VKTDRNNQAESVIGKGISQIKADFRTAPDPYLSDRINEILNQHDGRQSVPHGTAGTRNYIFNRPVIKLGWSLTAAAAAIFAGVIVGNMVLPDSYTIEKEAYRQEITMQSGDISGLSAEIINYYNEDNP